MKRLPTALSALALSLLVGAALWGCSSGNGDGSDGSGGYFDLCEEGVSAEDCYRERRDPQSESVKAAEDVALRWMENHSALDEIWDWRSGVLMFALTELHRVTENAELKEDLHAYYTSWLDFHIEQGYQIVWSDSCPPAITAVTLLNETPPDDYQQVVDDVLEYLDDVAPRTDEGGISHNGTLGKRSIWLDSLFMFGMVLNRYGELDQADRLAMMSEQILIFADVLQDDNGFMRHAQDWPGYDESVYWARGNSWVVASLSDFLRIAVEQSRPDPEVEEVFEDHVEAILGAQDETGMWLTVMSHPEEPDNYLETSATALFAYGVARAWRYGYLSDDDRDAAKRGAAYIRDNHIVDDVVTGVSVATDPWSLEEYLAVPIEDDVNYGVGAMILALIETSGLP